MDFGPFGVFIIAAVLGVQFFFSTRKNPFWGVIIPAIYTGYVTWLFLDHQIESVIKYVLFLLLGILFLIAEWKSGRKYFHEKRKKELEKMRVLDMN